MEEESDECDCSSERHRLTVMTNNVGKEDTGNFHVGFTSLLQI